MRPGAVAVDHLRMSIVGVAVPDERPLAGKIVGWMFVVGAIVTPLRPLLPGVAGEVHVRAGRVSLPLGRLAFGVRLLAKCRRGAAGIASSW